MWWYICTKPNAPCVGEFIDRPAVELHTWLWRTRQNKAPGVLVWETTDWTRPAPPTPARCRTRAGHGALGQPLRNGAGTRRSWGNGAGRFLSFCLLRERIRRACRCGLRTAERALVACAEGLPEVPANVTSDLMFSWARKSRASGRRGSVPGTLG